MNEEQAKKLINMINVESAEDALALFDGTPHLGPAIARVIAVASAARNRQLFDLGVAACTELAEKTGNQIPAGAIERWWNQ